MSTLPLYDKINQQIVRQVRFSICVIVIRCVRVAWTNRNSLRPVITTVSSRRADCDLFTLFVKINACFFIGFKIATANKCPLNWHSRYYFFFFVGRCCRQSNSIVNGIRITSLLNNNRILIQIIVYADDIVLIARSPFALANCSRYSGGRELHLSRCYGRQKI